MDLEHATTYPLKRATLIKTDGTTEELTPKGKSFTYKEIQDAIKPGCLIQLIQLRYWTHHKDFSKMNFICDEEGAINGSPYNEKATDLLQAILGPHSHLYGNVIFLPNKLYRLPNKLYRI